MDGAELESYADGVKQLTATGAEVAAYVYTGYGTRAVLDVLRDLWVMKQYFGNVSTVFFDEVTASSAYYDYYSVLAGAAHLLGLKTIFNPGTPPADSRFFNLSDVIVVSENSRNVKAEVASVLAEGIAGSQIAALQYATASNLLSTDFAQLLQAGAKYVYVTEYGGGSSNPWQNISEAYAQYVAAAAAANARILLPLYATPDHWETLYGLNGKPTTAVINPNNGRIAGGDLLSGGTANDLLYGTEGSDVLYGGSGNNELYGEGGNDLLIASGALDFLSGGSGDDVLLGLGGMTQVLYNGKASQFRLSTSSQGVFLADTTGVEGTDRLINVQRVHFSDQSLAFDVSANPASAMHLLLASIGQSGQAMPQILGQVISYLDWGYAEIDVAGIILNALGDPAPAAVLERVYRNVYGQAPSVELQAAAEQAFEAGLTGADVLLIGAHSSEIAAKVDLVGLASTGVAYILPG